MSAIFSTDAIKGELEATINKTQACLESFSVNTVDLTLLEEVQNYIGQLRGIFLVLEEAGPVRVCDEIYTSLNSIPVDSTEQTDEHSLIFDAISQALVVLNRFLELLSLNTQAISSIILLPSINKLRLARKAGVYGEGHFYDVSIVPGKPPSRTPVRITRETMVRLKKFRHMYQSGLVNLIRGNRTQGSMRYMGLALTRVDQLLGTAPCASLWWTASIALEAMVQNNASITAERKRLFALLDRELKVLIQDAPESLRKPSNVWLTKETLFLVALNRVENDRVKQVIEFYNLPTLSYTEAHLVEQRGILFSPGQGVLASVSDALKEDINGIKDSIDILARGGEFSAKDFHTKLTKVADVYLMLGLHSASNVLKGQAEAVNMWPDDAQPEQDDLLKIADVVLYAESALARLLQGQSKYDEDGDNKAFKAQLHEARIVLIDESESGLVLAKRAISAYVDSNGDASNLANVGVTLNEVYGALLFLGCEKAASLLKKLTNFVEQDLIEKGEILDHSQLEYFADALSSLEFYLEGLLSSHENLDVLKLAEHSLNSLKV